MHDKARWAGFAAVLFCASALAEPPVATTAEALRQPVETGWADVLAADLVAELARPVPRPVWIEHSAAERLARARVTFDAGRLPRLAALSWAARLADVRCLLRPEVMAFVPADAAPATWEETDRRLRAEVMAGVGPRDAAQRAILPLSGDTAATLATAIREAFGLAVWVDPAAEQSPQRVTLDDEPQTLEQVLQSAARQLGVTAVVQDGVVTLAGRQSRIQATAPPTLAGGDRLTSPLVHGYSGAGAGRGVLQVSQATMNWAELAQAAAERGMRIRLPAELAEQRAEFFDVEGPVEAVIAALLLAQEGGWTLRQAGEDWEIVAVTASAAAP